MKKRKRDGYPSRVFAAQLALSVLVWAALIAAIARSRFALIDTMRGFSRGRRVREALLRLFGSILAIALTMAFLSHGGLTPRGFTLWGWIATTALGGLFVLLQATALVPLMLNAVTSGHLRPSDKEDSRHP